MELKDIALGRLIEIHAGVPEGTTDILFFKSFRQRTSYYKQMPENILFWRGTDSGWVKSDFYTLEQIFDQVIGTRVLTTPIAIQQEIESRRALPVAANILDKIDIQYLEKIAMEIPSFTESVVISGDMQKHNYYRRMPGSRDLLYWELPGQWLSSFLGSAEEAAKSDAWHGQVFSPDDIMDACRRRSLETAVDDMLSDTQYDPYASLSGVLARAYQQASEGKGKERHANDLPFDQQPMQLIAAGHGVGFLTGQAAKKSQEAHGLPRERAVAELLGAINYLAGAVIFLERGR